MLLTRTASHAFDSALALVYPQRCAICNASVEGRSFGVACASCWANTKLFSEHEAVCWKCGRPTTGSVPSDRLEQVRCHQCDEDAFTAARAGGVYQGALRASILALKREPYVSSKLRALLIETQHRYPLNQATLVMPVPLHPERQKQRGFNQANVLARIISNKRLLPMDDSSLSRTRHIDRHRAGMDAKDRRKTVADAFEVNPARAVAGECVLLVDDVFTTGATVSSCAQSLMAAGATQVFVLTIARAIHA